MSLTVLITGADGVQYRLGPDEPDAAWVPENITWGSQVPGGWKEASFNLRRRIDEDVPLRLLDEVEIIDEHAQTVYEGRIQKLPRQHGEDFQLGVECLGWASHLLDDTSFREIYMDVDMSRWGEMSRSRHLDLLNFGPPKYVPAQWSVSLQNDGGISRIVHQTSRLISDANQRGIAESWYDAQGIPIGILFYVMSAKGPGGGADWVTVARLANDRTLVLNDTGTDHNGADGPFTTTVTATTTTRKFAVLTTQYDGTFTGDGDWTVWWGSLAVFGTHGIPAVQPAGSPLSGIYIDQMLADALSRACPKLNFTTGAGGSIERPSVVVPQAAYHEPTTVESVILDLNKYALWDWLVYDNRTFFYRPTDPDRLTWEARMDRGVHLSLEGDDAEHAYNGAIVTYSLPDGTRRVAGPTNSGFDVESTLLTDTDPENTVNAHGYPRRWIELDISFPLGADEYATIIGAAYLAQASLPSRSGDIRLDGEIEHPTKGMRPVREVRAGDWIRLSDHPADVPRRIISTNHTNDGLTTTVTVGNEMNKIDALLEQLGVFTRATVGS